MAIPVSKPANRSQRLFIELGTPLLLEPDSDAENTVYGELIGMQVANYLIVRLPAEDAELVQPSKNAVLHVKYFCSGEVFGFFSQVILSLAEPDRILFLDYPETVKSCNTRADNRVECFFPVRVSLADRLFKATIVNINLEGCLCVIENNKDIGEMKDGPVVIRFTIAGDSLVTIRGLIRNVRVQDGRIGFGVQFDKIDSFAKSALRVLIPALNI